MLSVTPKEFFFGEDIKVEDYLPSIIKFISSGKLPSINTIDTSHAKDVSEEALKEIDKLHKVLNFK